MCFQVLRLALVGGFLSVLAACGGSDDPTTAMASAGRAHRMEVADIPISQRIAAATETANSEINTCAEISPFYWEIGDGNEALAGGSRVANGERYTDSTRMNLASASKWLYSTYAVQRLNGALSESDLKMLQMRSGYTHFTVCYPFQTVRGCQRFADNDQYEAANDGRFYYDGGHMQKHAVVNGLGRLNRKGLTEEVMSYLGPNLSLQYGVPALAGGGFGNARGYAVVLRKIMRDELLMGGLLGSNPICTNPAVCPSEAAYSPTPRSESWHYSIGHWVEDDPAVGDGAFSSPGSLGFYPWIDASKSFYGIVAREAEFGFYPSVECGRLIRKAWQTGSPL